MEERVMVPMAGSAREDESGRMALDERFLVLRGGEQ
jgi:hypothetical protein